MNLVRKRLICAFDSDGCLDNFSAGVYDTLVALGKGHLWKSGENPDSYWNYFEDWKNDDGTPWTFAQFKELVDWGVDNRYIFTGHFRPGAKAAVDRVRALGHRVIIVTDRSFGSDPMNSQRNTLEAFERAGIKYDEIHFTAQKTSVYADTFVEDKLENYDALVANGTPSWLINRAWNKIPGGDGRNRINSVLDYARAVEALTEQGYADLQLV